MRELIFYFLAFFAFFFFTIVSSFCADIGKSETCLEPINGPNPFSSKWRDVFHTMVNKIEGPELARPWLSPTTANERRGPLQHLLASGQRLKYDRVLVEVRDV
jgi:hypothetical protein